MPSYNAKQQIRHLSERIKVLQEKRYMPSTPNLILDYSYRITDLIVKLIQKGGLQYAVPSYSDLENLYYQFPDKSKFSLTTLKQKHWLRIVADRVSIPSSIWTASNDIWK